MIASGFITHPILCFKQRFSNRPQKALSTYHDKLLSVRNLPQSQWVNNSAEPVCDWNQILNYQIKSCWITNTIKSKYTHMNSTWTPTWILLNKKEAYNIAEAEYIVPVIPHSFVLHEPAKEQWQCTSHNLSPWGPMKFVSITCCSTEHHSESRAFLLQSLLKSVVDTLYFQIISEMVHLRP